MGHKYSQTLKDLESNRSVAKINMAKSISQLMRSNREVDTLSSSRAPHSFPRNSRHLLMQMSCCTSQKRARCLHRYGVLACACRAPIRPSRSSSNPSKSVGGDGRSSVRSAPPCQARWGVFTSHGMIKIFSNFLSQSQRVARSQPREDAGEEEGVGKEPMNSEPEYLWW